jgi:DNA-binding GntR family transcriptional regulator
MYNTNSMMQMKTFPGVESPTVNLSHIRDVSMGELIKQEVLSAILRGELKPGDRINEPDVALRLGVSRVPVREALKALESTGLVVSKKHSGVFVRSIEEREITELYQLRASMDALAGRLLVQRLAQMPKAKQGIALLAELDNSIRNMEQMHGQPYYHENLKFHWLIVEGAANKSAADIYQQVVQKLHVARLGNLASEQSRLESIKEHKRILKAIRAGDELQVSQVMQAHVELARARSLSKPGHQ